MVSRWSLNGQSPVKQAASQSVAMGWPPVRIRMLTSDGPLDHWPLLNVTRHMCTSVIAHVGCRPSMPCRMRSVIYQLWACWQCHSDVWYVLAGRTISCSSCFAYQIQLPTHSLNTIIRLSNSAHVVVKQHWLISASPYQQLQYTISRFREIRSSKSASGFDLAVSAAK